MGKKSFVTALAGFAFGFGTPLRSNAGPDMIEPYRTRAGLQLRAAAAAAAGGIRSSSSIWRRGRAGLWLLRTRVRFLRRPPILRPTCLLARAPQALALTSRGSWVRRLSGETDRCTVQRVAWSVSVLISGNPACLSC